LRKAGHRPAWRGGGKQLFPGAGVPDLVADRPKSDSWADDPPRLVVVVPLVVILVATLILLVRWRRPSPDAVAPKERERTGNVVVTDVSPSRPPRPRPGGYPQPGTRPAQPARESAAEFASSEAPVTALAALPPTPSAASEGSIPTAGLLPASVGDEAIEISGKATLAGTPPPEVVIDMSADPTCSQLNRAPVTTRHYVVNRDGGLANVLVYVKSGLEGKRFPTSTNAPVIGQSNCFFEPYVLGVQVNQKFRLFNYDETIHNAHILPAPGSHNREQNVALPSRGSFYDLAFSSSEVFVRLKCDVHPWEFAYVGAVSHPFFAVTGTNGIFRLPPGLASGRYVVEAFHPKAGAMTNVISVGHGEKKNLEFVFRVPKR
jgi:hypothetical protein